jgi:xanthine dehydrogenase YagS FAD-binding subunit
MQLENGRIADIRIALGGVAHKPWRRPEAETLLKGQTPSRAHFSVAAASILEGAAAQGGNNFKIALAQKAIVRALNQAAEGTPQSQTDKRVA